MEGGMRNDGVLLAGDTVSILDRGDPAEEGGEVAGRSRFGVVILGGFCIVNGDCGTCRSGRNSKRYFAVRGGTESRGSIGGEDHFCMHCRPLVQDSRVLEEWLYRDYD
jgi:hypothetical protein